MPFSATFEELKRYFKDLQYLGLLPCQHKLFPEACSSCLLKQDVLVAESYPKKSGSINEVSDPEDELTDSQKTSKLSEIYSTTIPSVDNTVESWDGSAIDAGYGSQGKPGLCFLRGLWSVWVLSLNMSQSLWPDHICMASLPARNKMYFRMHSCGALSWCICFRLLLAHLFWLIWHHTVLIIFKTITALYNSYNQRQYSLAVCFTEYLVHSSLLFLQRGLVGHNNPLQDVLKSTRMSCD